MGAQQTFGGFHAMNLLRTALAGVIAVAFIGLVILLAAVLTATALVVGGIAALGASAYWLYRKVRGRKDREDGPVVLIAKPGPQGWSVDGDADR